MGYKEDFIRNAYHGESAESHKWQDEQMRQFAAQFAEEMYKSQNPQRAAVMQAPNLLSPATGWLCTKCHIANGWDRQTCRHCADAIPRTFCT